MGVLFFLNMFMAELEGNAPHTAVKTLQACKMSFRFELHRIVHLREARNPHPHSRILNMIMY